MEWVALTESLVLADFPTDLYRLYTTWVTDNPGKISRLSEITRNTIAEFRDAITNNPANVLDDDRTKIPQSCVRAAETIICFSMAMEMGVSLQTEAIQSMTRADLFLRQIQYKHFNTQSAATTSTKPVPIYTAPEARNPLNERMLP